jgi:hypothetical protein
MVVWTDPGHHPSNLSTFKQALLIQHRSLGQALQRAAAALGTPGDGAKLRDELHDLQGQADEVRSGTELQDWGPPFLLPL